MHKPLIMTWTFTSDAAGPRLSATWGTPVNAEQPAPAMHIRAARASVDDWPLIAGPVAERTRLGETKERLAS